MGKKDRRVESLWKTKSKTGTQDAHINGSRTVPSQSPQTPARRNRLH